MFARKYLWSLKALSRDGDCLIPETLGVSVSPVSQYSAFEGLKFVVTSDKMSARERERLVGEASDIFIDRYDECGNAVERWHLSKLAVSDIDLDDDHDGEYGELSFTVRGMFNKTS